MRLAYLDAARGIALVLMIVNHTARYWATDDLSRWSLIYVTTSAAGPTFLFLVGFVLPFSYRASPRPARRAVERAAVLLLAGYAVNLVLMPQQPLLGSNVLHTIGVALLVALLARPWLGQPLGRWAVGAAGVALYASFVLSYGAVTAWVDAHPLVGQLAFYDFPLWPWLSVVFLGLALGAVAADLGPGPPRDRFHAGLGWAALALAAGAFVYECWWPTSPRLAFSYDLLITNHWVPRGASVAWVLAWSLGTVAACFDLVQRRGLRLGALVRLGQAALFIYVVHHVLVVTFGQRALGVSLRSWPGYWLATGLLLAVLLVLANGWTAIRRARRPPAPGSVNLPAAA